MRSALLLVLTLALTGACQRGGDGDFGDGGQDSGPSQDSGQDSSPSRDSGQDSSPSQDSGPSRDSGPSQDSGQDSGPSRDSGQDSGPSPDSGQDSGSSPDSGPDASSPAPPILSAHPTRLALPAEAPYLLGHPLIFDGRLYLRSTNMPGVGVGNQVVSCHDLRDDNRLLWRTSLGESLFILHLNENTGIGVGLTRSDEHLPIITTAFDMDQGEMTQRFFRVNAFTGTIDLAVDIPSRWSGLQPNGRLRTLSVSEPHGSPVEYGGLIYYSNGAMINGCDGSVVWSDSKTTGDAIIAGDHLFSLARSGGARVTAIDLTQARAELLGFMPRGTMDLFETDAGEHAIAQPGNSGNRDFLLHRGHIIKTRERRDVAGLEDGYYLERHAAQDGQFVDRTRVPFEAQEVSPGQISVYDTWHELMVMGYSLAVGETLLFPAMRTYILEGGVSHGALFAFDLNTLRFLWRADWPGGPIHPHTTVVASRDFVYAVERRVNRADSPLRDRGFRVHRFDLVDGHPSAIFQDDETWGYEAGAVGILAFDMPDGTDAFAPEVQPLLYHGKLYLTATGPTGSVIWILDVGDDSANVLKYKFNNQLNPVMNLERPESNQAQDPAPAPPPEAEVSQSTPLAPPFEGEDSSLDEPPGEAPFAPALDALGLTAEDLDTRPRAFVATLAEITFSQSGEADVDNLGEGYLRLRSRFGCGEVGLRYPWRGFLGLHRPFAWLEQPSEPAHLDFTPQIPVFYRPEAWLEGANMGLTLGWSALEDDTSTGLDRLVQLASDLIDMVKAYLSGDYCRLAQQIADAVAAEANDHTQHFGAPFLTLFGGSEAAPPNLYGVPLGEARARFEISGSGTRGVLVAAADAVDAACAIGSLASPLGVTRIDNAVGSTLEAFSPEDRSTHGVFELRRARFVPIRALSVTLDRLEIATQHPIAVIARAGLVGEDPVSAAPDGAVSAFETPFQSYVKRDDLPLLAANADLAQPLIDFTLSPSPDRPGTAALYLELGLTTLDPLSPGTATLSETRFLEDLLYGAWQLSPNGADHFEKTVRRRIDTPTLQGYLQLTYRLRTAR
ncbi:MSCRAMM family adhesin SdrC [Myxococcota bacterium]|nr:MSCRAMM family adhesin SdrC [Myxococcota bacterium]